MNCIWDHNIKSNMCELFSLVVRVISYQVIVAENGLVECKLLPLIIFEIVLSGAN